MELDWHSPTSIEIAGVGYKIILDVSPDWIPDQAAEYKGVLVRTSKPGWSWRARTTGQYKKGVPHLNEVDTADTQEQALADGLKCVRRFQAQTKLAST